MVTTAAATTTPKQPRHHHHHHKHRRRHHRQHHTNIMVYSYSFSSLSLFEKYMLLPRGFFSPDQVQPRFPKRKYGYRLVYALEKKLALQPLLIRLRCLHV